MGADLLLHFWHLQTNLPEFLAALLGNDQNQTGQGLKFCRFADCAVHKIQQIEWQKRRVIERRVMAHLRRNDLEIIAFQNPAQSSGPAIGVAGRKPAMRLLQEAPQ